MFIRNLLLAVGAVLVLAGLGLSLVWINQMQSGPAEVRQEFQTQAPEVRLDALLEAAHPLPAGTLLRPGDIRWREIQPGASHPGVLLRNQVSDAEYLGAIARRDFSEGEALVAADLVKTGDRRFLSAVLKPGNRAVSIAVDAPQSSSGLVLPGDRVDVILTQNLGESAIDASHKTVAETVLRNVRVIAVDQRLNLQPKAVSTELAPFESRMPKTVTLELNGTQAEKLFVAAQLGGLQLAVRPLEGSDPAVPGESGPSSTWAADVSPALRHASRKLPQAPPSGSTIEGSVRRPPALAY
ncbi:MAG: Flp pilus assembly protein CpaB [Rhodomicrobium sp.]